MVLTTDRTATSKTYQPRSNEKKRQIFSKEKYMKGYRDSDTSRTASKNKQFTTASKKYENSHTARKIRRKIFDTYKED